MNTKAATLKFEVATTLDASVLNWRDMKSNLSRLNEAECWALIRSEQQGKNRPQWLLRMYGRATKLREQRERQGLFTGGGFELPTLPKPKEGQENGDQDSGSNNA